MVARVPMNLPEAYLTDVEVASPAARTPSLATCCLDGPSGRRAKPARAAEAGGARWILDDVLASTDPGRSSSRRDHPSRNLHAVLRGLPETVADSTAGGAIWTRDSGGCAGLLEQGRGPGPCGVGGAAAGADEQGRVRGGLPGSDDPDDPRRCTYECDSERRAACCGPTSRTRRRSASSGNGRFPRQGVRRGAQAALGRQQLDERVQHIMDAARVLRS